MEKYRSTAIFLLVLITTALISGFLVTSSMGFNPIKQNTNLGDVKFSSVKYVKDKYKKWTTSNVEKVDINITLKKKESNASLHAPINIDNLSDNQLARVKAIIAANQKANLDKQAVGKATADKTEQIKKEGK